MADDQSVGGQGTQPNPALRRLDRLVGEWTLTGRSMGVAEDDIKGWVVIEEYEHPALTASGEFGGPTRVGAKLAILEDGSLAIGQWRRLHGRKASIYTWGDRSVGSMPVADVVTWYWSRYQRLPAK